MTITEEQRYWSERNFVVDLLKQLPSHIFWKNRDSVYLGCNDAFAQSLGLSSPEEVIGKTDYDLSTTKEESDAYRADDLDVMHSRQAKLNIEETQTLPNGKIITLLTSKVPLLDKNSEVIGVLGIYSDITERKKMELALKEAKEKAEAANHAKSMFIANISHDLRTPISGVIGMAEMLEKEGGTQKDREFGHIIHESSDSLLSLLNDILLIISVDATKEEYLRFETFNLKERIYHIEELFASSTKIKNIKFKINFAKDLPEYITSDRIKIDRILLNLIGNALKFTDKGYVKLTTKFLVKNNKTMIEFSVRDTGVGIPEDKIDKIFERFYRVTPSYEGKYTGFGIGLFIVKKFVSLLKGNIKVKSELGRGTTFTVTLPVKIEKEKTVTEQINEKNNLTSIKTRIETAGLSCLIPNNNGSNKKQKRLKILFIEDDNIAKRTGQYFLEAAGFKVETVSDGEEGLKKLKSSMFDLVITDIGLPGIDGIELAFLIRRWEKRTNKVPMLIVGSSAHASSDIEKEALEVGMNLVLEKPIDEGKIKKMIGLLQEKEVDLANKGI